MDERSAVVSALLQLDAFPAGMELFPAADDDAWTLIQRVIDASDYYLLVIGGKYGSIDPATEISYTEMEYDYAVSLGKPVLAFLHGDPDTIELGRSEKDDAARQKLEEFRKKVETKKHVKYWKGPEDLAGKVALSFASFRQTYPAVGWVRGDVQTSTESLSEINELRKKLELAEQKLESARSGPPPGTANLSQGDDTVEFVAGTETRARTRGNAYGERITAPLAISVTWDEIFSAVGPQLLDEAPQGDMDARVDEFLTARLGSAARRQARKDLEDSGETVSSFHSTKVWLSTDDFGTVLVQLRALGLITRSDRKRSVKDTATYWTLTPYGDEHLTTLRAISREITPDDNDPGDSGEHEEEEEEE